MISVMEYYNNSFVPFYDKEKGEIKIKNRVSKIIKGDFIIEQVGNSELFEISYGKQTFFTTADIDYLFVGKIIKLADKSFSKMFTNENRAKLNRTLLRLYSDSDMIIHKPLIDKIGDLFVFIDYSCPFCLKFHENNLKSLLKLGYQVNYIPFLKNPDNNLVKSQMLNLFCLPDNEKKKDLINHAFSNPKSFTNEKIEVCSRKEYIQNIFSITNFFNFKGTPAILLYNGNYVEGYVPLQDLVLELESNK